MVAVLKVGHAVAASALALVLLSLPAASVAEPLRIGLATGPTSLDPHHHNFAPNNTIALHVFETLLGRDAADQPKSGLAQSWSETAPRIWQLELRRDAVFHDGRPVTARDVIYSYCRARIAKGSPLTFGGLLRPLEMLEATGSHQLRAVLRQRFLMPPRIFSSLAIVPAPPGFQQTAIYRGSDCTDGSTSVDLSSDPVPALGSGAFRFGTAAGENVITLSPAKRGPAMPWSSVTFRVIEDPIRRVRALNDGEVDVIEQVPANSIEVLQRASFQIVSAPANRLIHLQMEQQREPLSDVADTGGRNPFKDVRVRQAISGAIDREALAERIMGGFATPVWQLVRPDMEGYAGDLKDTDYNLAQARDLLSQAGFANGFSVRLVTPDGRYPNDRRVAEAIAAMLHPLGIKVSVEAIPASQHFTSDHREGASFFLAGNAISVAGTALRALAVTRNPSRDTGTSNFGGYSNPAVDALYEQSIAEPDPERQVALVREANRIASHDAAVIPLFYGMTIWALDAKMQMTPRVDQMTLAADIRRR